MTVSNSIRRSGPYLGNGVSADFAYEFRILDAAHLRVVLRAADGAETTLAPGTDYTVSAVGADGGGNVTLTTAPASGETVTIIRNMPLTQGIDLENQGEYYAETVEEGLDATVMAIQQLREELDRSVKVPVSGDVAEVDELMANVRTIAAMADDVEAVAGDLGAVETLAGAIADVEAVAASISAVAAVAANTVPVATVAAHSAEVAALAEEIGSVVLAAAKIAAIEAAPAAAQAAVSSAALVEATVDAARLGSVPLGALIWMTTPVAPPGYLFADGSGVTPVYPQLRQFYLNAGAPHGVDSSGNPRLPNIARRFVRGHDTATGRAFGSYQADAFQGHGLGDGQGRRAWVADESQYPYPTTLEGWSRIAAGTDATTAGGASLKARLLQPMSNGTHGTPRVADETRPENITLYPCIKAADGIDNPGLIDSNGLVAQVAALEQKLSISQQIFHAQDRRPAGVHGGDFTAGAWRVRPLNTVLQNGVTEAEIASNQIFLPSGRYHIEIQACAYAVSAHQARLYNITDGVAVLTGLSNYSENSGTSGVNIGDSAPANVRGVVTLTSSKVFEIQHRCSSTRTMYGFGTSTISFGTDNVYCDVMIRSI
jgi:hypothetical protein